MDTPFARRARTTRISTAALSAGLLGIAGLLGLVACGSGETPAEAGPAAATEEVAVIDVADFGTIKIRFFDSVAPRHVDNFKKLARSGFYDHTTFHRVIPNFMIQGGDPLSKDDNPANDGVGGPGYTIDQEFNAVPHRRGIVSMARAKDPNSAGSQFFIMVADKPEWKKVLDGRYTVFGEVYDGMSVVDKIVASERDRNDRPLKDVVMTSVRIESAPETELPALPPQAAAKSADAG